MDDFVSLVVSRRGLVWVSTRFWATGKDQVLVVKLEGSFGALGLRSLEKQFFGWGLIKLILSLKGSRVYILVVGLCDLEPMLGEENLAEHSASSCLTSSLHGYLVPWQHAKVLNWATDSSTLYGGFQGSLYCEAGASEASSVMSARGIATAVFFCFLFLAASSGAGG
ncbi:hypothetical protein ARMGADRAFT_1029886 [Armillaria gallica]|uniref:Uncharacterized protein n=1 Tax=Armillaria gallica TaxID=47427 RepID=A0A2H3DT86_ARMGA|nr:hypothetical protein ARMGADRAFT_1029886 [Armillaria gallica]